MATTTTRFTPPQASTPELAAYFADKRILWRNVATLMVCNSSWHLVGTVVGPLMMLHMSDCGVSNGTLGLISAINLWAVSILVMYFSWLSDHTVSRFGRRMPYFFLSAAFIIATQALFPWFTSTITLITLYAVMILFNDLKASTYVLLPIDCFPRENLAKFNSIFGIVGGLVGFVALQWGFGFPPGREWVPFVGGAAVMAVTSLIALLIREPPVRNPTTESWKPWSALAVGWKDRRTIVLMVGVGLIHSFSCMYGAWIWLFAKQELHLEKSIIAQAMSWSPLLMVALAWPLGYVIDRFGGLRVVIVYFVLQIITFVLAMNIHDQGSLLMAAIAMTITGPFYAGADMMIFKTAPTKDVGSITSSNSFTRNLMQGFLAFGAGYLIQATGNNYRSAFVLGMILSTVGFAMFFIHRRLMVRGGVSANEP
jgi:MFS family permease